MMMSRTRLQQIEAESGSSTVRSSPPLTENLAGSLAASRFVITHKQIKSVRRKRSFAPTSSPSGGHFISRQVRDVCEPPLSVNLTDHRDSELFMAAVRGLYFKSACRTINTRLNTFTVFFFC